MSTVAIKEEIGSAAKKLVRGKTILSTLIDERISICLPSSLWGVHIDTERKYFAFSMLKIGDGCAKTSKSVILLETDDYTIKTEVFLNDTLVQIPHVSTTVYSIQKLNALLKAVDAVEFCKYYSADKKQNNCSIVKLPFMDVCRTCLYNPCITNPNLKQEADKAGNITPEKLRDITFYNDQKNSTNYNDNTRCGLCNKKVSNKQELSVHCENHVSTNAAGEFHCTINNINPMLEHYELHHSNAKGFKPIRNKKYDNMAPIKSHMRDHTKYETLPWGHFNKSFVCNQELKKHDCIASSIKPTSSKHHICSTCNTKFTTNHLLQQHQREHQIHISVKCKKCERVFSSRDAAVQHKIYCVDKELKYPCSLCDRKFSCISQKMNHVKRVHPMCM